MIKKNILYIIIIASSLSTHLSCAQLQSKLTPQNKEAQPKKFWTTPKIIIAAITGAVAITFAAFIAKPKIKKETEVPAEYVQFQEALNKLTSIYEVASLISHQPWKQLIETNQGKHLVKTWYSLKLPELQKAIATYQLAQSSEFHSPLIDTLQHRFRLEPNTHPSIWPDFWFINNKNGRTPLTEAIDADLSPTIILMMIDLGADVTLEDDRGSTPLDAVEKRIQLLQDRYLPDASSEQERQIILRRITNLENIHIFLEHAIKQQLKGPKPQDILRPFTLLIL